MKKLIVLLALLGLSIAPTFADEIDDLFAGGVDSEFDFERFDDNNVFTAIAHDAAIACKGGLCTLSSVDTNYNEFSINLNGGMGNNSAASGSGSFDGGSGVTINNNANVLSFEDRLHVGINIKYKRGNCTRKVKVPRALYIAINRYMYGLMDEEGNTLLELTSADEAMILFYTTIMKQANGCK